jgi:hypothetical protein
MGVAGYGSHLTICCIDETFDDLHFLLRQVLLVVNSATQSADELLQVMYLVVEKRSKTQDFV